MGGSFGTGLMQGLVQGYQTGEAMRIQGQEYEIRKQALTEEKKKLDTYNTALSQLKMDDPELYSAITLGFGDKLLAQRKQKGALEGIQKLIGGGAAPAPQSQEWQGVPHALPEQQPQGFAQQAAGASLQALINDPRGALLLGTLLDEAGTGLKPKDLVPERRLVTTSKEGRPVQAWALPGEAPDLSTSIPAAPSPALVTESVTMGGRPWKRVRRVDQNTGQDMEDPRYVDPDDWNKPLSAAEVQGGLDLGVPLRMGMTQGDAYLLSNQLRQPSPQPGRPALGPIPTSGGPLTSTERAAADAAATKAAQLRVEQRMVPLSADEMAKYMDPSGLDLEGSWTQADIRQGLDSGRVVVRPKATGGETTKNLAVLVPKALADLDEMERAIFPDGKTFDPTVLNQAEMVPELGGQESSWNPKVWLDRVQRITGAAPAARRFVELQGSTQELVGRLLSGGVINPEEAARFVRSYIPRAGVNGPGAVTKLNQLRQIYMSLQKIGAPETMSLGQKAQLRKLMGLGSAPPPVGRGNKAPPKIIKIERVK